MKPALPLRVVQASCPRDPIGRTGTELLAAWPTLGDVAEAAAAAGAEVTVLQAAYADAAGAHREALARASRRP